MLRFTRAFFLVTLLVCAAQAQESVHRRLFIIVPEHVNYSGGQSGSSVYGNAVTYNRLGDVIKAYEKGCPGITFTRNRDNADYVIEVQAGNNILSNAKGEILTISKARWRFKDLVKDTCPKMM